MTLNSTDILNIQSAIDRYEKRFPRRPSPSADDALAWQAGKRRGLPQPNARDRSELRHTGIWFRIFQSFRVWRQRGARSKERSAFAGVVK
jgi:hypothetical protein